MTGIRRSGLAITGVGSRGEELRDAEVSLRRRRQKVVLCILESE